MADIMSKNALERLDASGRSQQELFPDQPTAPARTSKSRLAVDVDGFSVEAGVHFGALDRKGREQPVRSCLRPAIANERLSILRDGTIAYLCKYPTRGKTPRVMQPLERMARLAAIVPPPRFPLWRYHGVLAPAAPSTSPARRCPAGPWASTRNLRTLSSAPRRAIGTASILPRRTADATAAAT